MSDKAAREFQLGSVLTVATGSPRPFCPLGDLYAILGFLLADVPAADAISEAIDNCQPTVLEQHPELAAVQAPPADAPDTEVLVWLADMEAVFGETLPLTTPGLRTGGGAS